MRCSIFGMDNVGEREDFDSLIIMIDYLLGLGRDVCATEERTYGL